MQARAGRFAPRADEEAETARLRAAAGLPTRWSRRDARGRRATAPRPASPCAAMRRPRRVDVSTGGDGRDGASGGGSR